MIVRDCLYVRARGLRDREGESYAPGVHRMSDRATRQRVGDARLRKRERESCIPRVDRMIVRDYRDVRDGRFWKREGPTRITGVDGVICNASTLAAQGKSGRSGQ